MKVRALISFGGNKLSMFKGQVLECDDKVTLEDLIKAKYIEEVKESKSTSKKSSITREVNINESK